jgi:hypothetical protein
MLLTLKGYPAARVFVEVFIFMIYVTAKIIPRSSNTTPAIMMSFFEDFLFDVASVAAVGGGLVADIIS